MTSTTMTHVRRLSGLTLLIAASCTFGSTRPIITSAEVASVLAVANNTNADIMFIGDASGKIAQADPLTGTVENSVWTWMADDSRVVALTPDGEDNDEVWALHANGYLLNWADGPVMTAWFNPPPVAAGRTYCDLDHTQDGVFYVSTVDAGQAKVWRRHPSFGWSSTNVDDDECVRVSHDLLHDEFYVLREGAILERRDTNSMALVSSVALDADGGAMGDVDIFGQVGVGAGTTSGPVGPWGPLPGVPMAWTFDPISGFNDAAMIRSGSAVSSVQISINADASTAEMLISAPAGATTVSGVLLEN